MDESSTGYYSILLLEDSLEELLEKTGFFLSDSEKTEGETKEGGMDGNKKRSIDGGKRGASIKKSKRMKLLVQQLKLSVLRLIQYLQHHNLNCTSISHDGSLTAGGFSDSSLKVLLSYLTQHPHADRW
uniref:Uncharacterized protein n=1 Tax=Salix viminalis TaxID=40686 RepID=A0A6N2KNC4_SALVM